MSLTIYHNPRCSKSRQTLELIERAGVQPTIVLYLTDPPSAARILDLAGMLQAPVLGITRTGDTAYREAQDLPEPSDDAGLATWLAAHPGVLERPIVVDEQQRLAIVGRPPDNVMALLPG